MEEFNTSLVREKITFIDGGVDSGKEPTVIRSNRVFLRLGISPSVEKTVIRTQNMHTTLRLTSKILLGYYRGGHLMGREPPFDWEAVWTSCLSDYEKEYNHDLWAAVYIGGKPVFRTVTSPFVDVIEKCALLTLDNYDATMDVTEAAMKQIGHAVHLDHSSNIAATFSDAGDSTRCGIIHREGSKDTIFNFTVSGGDRNNRIVQSMGAAAAYLELFTLRFFLRSVRDKIRMGEIAKAGPENMQMRAAIGRQNGIKKAILSFEDAYRVTYRPAKPEVFFKE